MKVICVCLTTLLIGLASPVFATDSAQDLFQSCEKLITEAESHGEKIMMTGSYNDGYCWGAFAMIQESLNIGFSPDSHPAFYVCLPPSSTRVQLIRIFVKYVHEHPEYLHRDAFKVTRLALLEVFPCK